MPSAKKESKKSGFNVHTPKVGLFPAGSITGVSSGKVVLSSTKKKKQKTPASPKKAD